MAVRRLLTEIIKENNYPEIISIYNDLKNNYIEITPNNWEAKMFYELPKIEIKLYKVNNKLNSPEEYFSKVVYTYHPLFSSNLQQIYCFNLPNIVHNSFISIYPLFDTNSIQARNELIIRKIEIGDIWNANTVKFPILIDLISN